MSKQRRPATSGLMCGNCANKHECKKKCLGYDPIDGLYIPPHAPPVFCEACPENDHCTEQCTALAHYLGLQFREKSSVGPKYWSNERLEGEAATREGHPRKIRGLF